MVVADRFGQIDVERCGRSSSHPPPSPPLTTPLHLSDHVLLHRRTRTSKSYASLGRPESCTFCFLGGRATPREICSFSSWSSCQKMTSQMQPGPWAKASTATPLLASERTSGGLTDLVGKFELLFFSCKLLRFALQSFDIIDGSVEHRGFVRVRIRSGQQ